MKVTAALMRQPSSQTHIELESQEIIDKDDMDPARMLRIACDQELTADRIR